MPVVSVAGASGYAGGELLRLIAGHPQLQLGPVTAGSRAGERIAVVHPHLVSLGDRLLLETSAEVLAEADLVFLALPHGESANLVARLPASLKIVDLGADFRLRDSLAWQNYYGGTHAGAWTYGLAELPGARALISASERVANPGCYATAVALALAPILGSRLGDPREAVVVAASGTSGAGRKAVEGLLASEIMGSMSAYKVGGVHQHIPEMEQSLSDVASGPVRLSFTPLLAPMPRGILATCTVAVTQDASTQMVRACLDEAYRDEEFVHLLPEGAWPRTSSVLGSNGAHLQGGYDEHAGRIVVVIAIDNLGKGAAGQAVQNANLMLGLPEGAALGSIGVAP
ncbi:MAG: N-acetyl-gamma-glutamyl-phosphate reductase [Actinomycetales bacterium]